jgi:hypothetical protein
MLRGNLTAKLLECRKMLEESIEDMRLACNENIGIDSFLFFQYELNFDKDSLTKLNKTIEDLPIMSYQEIVELSEATEKMHLLYKESLRYNKILLRQAISEGK